MDSVPRTPPSPPGQCPPPGRSWPLSLQDSQSCCRHLGWLPGPRGTSGRPGRGETWLGCSGAAVAKASSSGKRASALRKEVGEGAGGEWGVSCPYLASSPAWSSDCPRAVKPGMAVGGGPRRTPGRRSLGPGAWFPVCPGAPLCAQGSAAPAVTRGHWALSSRPCCVPRSCCLCPAVGEGVAGASAAAPELAGACLLPSGLRVLLVSGCRSVCHPCPYASSARHPFGCPSLPESLTNPALPWHGRGQALLAQLPFSRRVL